MEIWKGINNIVVILFLDFVHVFIGLVFINLLQFFIYLPNTYNIRVIYIVKMNEVMLKNNLGRFMN